MNKLFALAALLALLGGSSIVHTAQTASDVNFIGYMAVSVGLGGIITFVGALSRFNTKAVLTGVAASVISILLIFSCERVMPISVALLLSGAADLVLSVNLMRLLTQIEKPKRKNKL